jgi:hypothetical protein
MLANAFQGPAMFPCHTAIFVAIRTIIHGHLPVVLRVPFVGILIHSITAHI